MRKPSVLLTSEGTYPCSAGGVSVWCDYLLRHLPDTQFHLFALTQSPSQRMQFAPPVNVLTCQLHPLWGTEEPGPYPQPVSDKQQCKLQTSPKQINSRFRDPLEAAFESLLSSDPDAEQLADGFYRLHKYFQTCDYAASMQSRTAWECFLQAVSKSGLDLTLNDATVCMRWLQRYLSLLAASFPKVDLVHSSMAGLAGIPGVLCKLDQGSGYVLTEHGVFLRELYLALSKSEHSIGARRFLVRFYGAIVRMNYHYADVVTTLGEFNRQWQVRCGADPSKIRVVPNGIDPAKFRPRASAPRTRITVLTMARIFPLKGIDILIRAAALVRDRVPEVHFRVLGDVADRKYYAECLKLVEEFQLHQTISFDETHDPSSAYCEADIFCLPSRSEGLPFAVIEAMMCACPVVASDVGNVADLLSGTGLTFTPNNPQELATALLQLISGPDAEQLRASLACAALARANRYFTIEQFAGSFGDIYKEIQVASASAVLSRTAS